MADYGIYKNSEGYADPTAAEAIKGMAKPGEIWLYKDRECLIVKNQGTYCNILQLSAKYKRDSVAVAEYWAHPGMFSYAFNDLLGECIGKLTDDEYNAVVEEVAEVLQMPLVQKEQQKQATSGVCVDNSWVHELVEKQKIIIREKEDEAQRLRGQVELMKNLYNELLNKCIDKMGA